MLGVLRLTRLELLLSSMHLQLQGPHEVLMEGLPFGMLSCNLKQGCCHILSKEAKVVRTHKEVTWVSLLSFFFLASRCCREKPPAKEASHFAKDHLHLADPQT